VIELHDRTYDVLKEALPPWLSLASDDTWPKPHEAKIVYVPNSFMLLNVFTGRGLGHASVFFLTPGAKDYPPLPDVKRCRSVWAAAMGRGLYSP
jgi:hypothetical protein